MTFTQRLARLFEPMAVGNLTLANRFVMAPMNRGFSPGGVPGANVVEYYRRRASLGLIVSEGVGVDHPAALGVNAIDGSNIPVLHGDEAMSGWRKVTDAVHAAGGKIMPQLWHQGAMRREGTGPHPSHPSTKPSGIWGPEGRAGSISPDEMIQLLRRTKPASESEIADVIAAFVRSATNAKAAGFDGIALHGAHGDLHTTIMAGSAAVCLDPLLERFNAGEFDLVGLGRSVIADPDFVAKLRSGEPRTRFVVEQLYALN
jgi:2,4-dienoyl-CoA reductase-like NADH-dependent reductase (Old Yellow Enzyme family)